MSLALTPTDRERLFVSGHLVSPNDELSRRRVLWQAAVGKARAAFNELQHAERSYLAEVQRAQARGSLKRIPRIDPYLVTS